jgi:cytidylate kinase
MSAPVVTIDGPTASGKGTVAERVASRLGFHYLDSGSLYRLVALLAMRQAVAFDDADRLAALAAGLAVRFVERRILLGEDDVTEEIRGEAVGNGASRIALCQPVRDALLGRQRAYRVPPGLVCDGRDMGTVVFPDATLKIFLTASVEQRAERRSKQLIEKGFPVNISTLLQDLRERDARDAGRQNAPLAAAPDAISIDSSDLSVEDVVNVIVSRYLG